MSRFSLLRRSAAAAAVLSLAAAGAAEAKTQGPRYDDAPSSGRVLFVTTDQNQLIRFNSNRPDRIKDIRAITGLAAGATLTGIDFRPATGDLYGVGSDSVVYRISPRTGIAVAEAPGVHAAAQRPRSSASTSTRPSTRSASPRTPALNLRLNVDEGTVLMQEPR